jgi:hypothetical protein
MQPVGTPRAYSGYDLELAASGVGTVSGCTSTAASRGSSSAERGGFLPRVSDRTGTDGSQEQGTFADTQLAEHDRRMSPMPPRVRLFQAANGETTRLNRDQEHESEAIAELAEMERQRDALAARINAWKRGRQGACADPQAAQRHRPDEDEDPDSWSADGRCIYDARGSPGASSASSTASGAGVTSGCTATGSSLAMSDALNALARNRRVQQAALTDDIFAEVPARPGRSTSSLFSLPSLVRPIPPLISPAAAAAGPQSRKRVAEAAGQCGYETEPCRW